MVITKAGMIIARSHTRVVSSDRGSYVEMEEEAILEHNLHIPNREKWRTQLQWEDKIYYIEYRSNCKTNAKVYYQTKRVNYADYKIGKWYVSLEDVDIKGEPN